MASSRVAKVVVKPAFSNGGGGFLTTIPGTYTIHDPSGNVVETVHGTHPGEGGNIKIPSDTIASGLPQGSYIEGPNGTKYTLSGPPGSRQEFDEDGRFLGSSGKGALGSGGGGRGAAGGGAQGMFPISGGGFVGSGPGAVPLPSYIDPSSIYQPFQPTDILGFAGQTADFNRNQYQQSFDQAQEYAKGLISTELESLKSFATGAEGLQENLAMRGNQFNRQEIGTSNRFNQGEFSAANTFNQDELDRSLNRSAPFIRPAIQDAVKRNETYAQGKLLSTAEDRAFELTARSLSADNSFVSGFGGDSAVADKASTLLSAQQRLQLSMQGDQALSGWLSKANDLLISKPLQYTPLIQQPLQSTIAGDIKGQPRIAGSQLAADQTAQLSGLTTIAPQAAVGMQVQQNEFGQQLNFDQRTAVYNALLGYSNTLLGQMNTYAGQTAGYAQQGVSQNFASAGLNSNGAPPVSSGLGSAVPPQYSGAGVTAGGGTSLGAPGSAPTVATQAQARVPQLTTDDLYRYYQ